MKNIRYLSFGLFLILVGFINYNHWDFFQSQNDTGVVSGVSHEPTTSSQNTIGLAHNQIESIIPTTISIPKLDVETKVEHVGLDDRRYMDVPKDPLNAAWYKLGVQPGAVGNAVIAGHYDLPNGDPSIFAEIDTLQQGDVIRVENSLGDTLTFQVTDTQVFPEAEFPIDLVFGQTDSRMLNLITCEGVFDQESQNYSHRLVVFTELVEEEVL